MSWFFSFFLVIFAGKRFWVESSFFQHLKHLPLPSGFYEFHGEIYYNSNCLLLSVTCHFSITAFKRFSLSFIFKSLTLICFVVDLFGFPYLGFFFRILNLRVYVFSNFGRFSAIISLTTFQPRLSSHLFRIVDTNFLSLLQSHISLMWMIVWAPCLLDLLRHNPGRGVGCLFRAW